MKLYGYYRSSTSYRLRIALNLKQLPHDNIPVDLLTGEHRGEAFLSRNPFGTVPALESDGAQYAQSMAMLEWLDEQYPDHPLLPPHGEARVVARELTYAIATELHAPLNLAVLKYLKSELGQDQSAIDKWYHHWLARTLEPIEKRLEQMQTGGLLADAPGLFEVVLIPQLYNARRFNFELANFPRITAIESHCLGLPAFVAAHPDNQVDSPQKGTVS